MAEEGPVVDPYSPPKATLDSGSVPLPPRPWAVLMVQIVGWLILISTAVRIAWACLATASFSVRDLFGNYFLQDLAIALAFEAALGAMLFCIHRRLQTGRVLGIVFLLLSLFVILFLVDQIPVFIALQGASRSAVIFILAASVSYWIRAFGFSSRARRYFARSQSPRLTGNHL